MNTYQVTYFPPGVTSAVAPLTVQAVDFLIEDEFVLFVDASRTSVLAVPLTLNPIIVRTATT